MLCYLQTFKILASLCRLARILKASKEQVKQIALCLILSKTQKTFSCSTQLSMKFILLINVKMLTIVGILTFISRINATSEILNARI